MSKFDEKMLEDYIIKKLQKDKGWTFIPANELERDNFEEPLLTANLVRKIKELNKDKEISEEEIRRVINELNSK